ncbi:hypothetical protein AB0F88_17050 [Streptosporangium sp. NPDC023963]|uniref:hypothetical protein n=1 Tax=Streptosporangium sp. NPDC023963 TaxID=3155608 RepID=UPI00342EFAB5
MSEISDSTNVMARVDQLLDETGTTPDEQEFIESLVLGGRGEAEILLSLLTKARKSGRIAKARSAW